MLNFSIWQLKIEGGKEARNVSDSFLKAQRVAREELSVRERRRNFL
jgi:hypothetical protein